MTSTLKEISVLLCGEAGSGKKSLCSKFASSHFPGQDDPPGQAIYRKQHQVDNGTYTTSLSTANTEDSPSFTQQCQASQAFLLVYSITSAKALAELRAAHARIIQQQQQQQQPHINGDSDSSPPAKQQKKPIFLVGTKLDLEPERQVSLEEARSLAIELKCQKWFEVSAKTQTDEINDLFTKLIRESERLNQIPPIATQPQRTTTNGTDPSILSNTPTSPSSPRKGGMMERFKFGSLKRKESLQSLVRKKSGSFSTSVMSFGSDARLSKDQAPVTSPGTTSNGLSYRLDVDTSAWRETVKWPAEIIPE